MTQGKELRLYCMAPAPEAFHEANFSRDTHEALAEVMKACVSLPTVKCLGPTLGGDEFCQCEAWGSLIIFTHFIRISSPVSCGNCGRPVARYKLTSGGEEADEGLRSWESLYQACDTLHMNSDVGELFGYSQMSQVSSELATRGRGVGRYWSEKVGVPVFYYLHRYEDEPLKKCPECLGDWRVEERYRFILWCDRCFLVAGEDPSPRDPGGTEPHTS